MRRERHVLHRDACNVPSSTPVCSDAMSVFLASLQESVSAALDKFELKSGTTVVIAKDVARFKHEVSATSEPGVARLLVSEGGRVVADVPVACGKLFGSDAVAAAAADSNFVSTTSHIDMLSAMMLDHAVGKDSCIIGGKVCALPSEGQPCVAEFPTLRSALCSGLWQVCCCARICVFLGLPCEAVCAVC